jgi:moderate conductance mechanosensitive channel
MSLQLPRPGSTPAEVGWLQPWSWDRIMPELMRVGIIVLAAALAYQAVKLFTRRLERDIAEQDPVVKRRREQRARTLASLLNNFALVVIVIVTGLTILNAFIDTAPLLATAGVAGLALSFGAQSLVRDLISGTFILLEGQFAIGDVIRVDATAGMVERITLRTTTLRDHEGVVHVIPNGEIKTVSNLTKTWSRAVLDVGVAYRENVDDVMAVLRDLGAAMYADEDWRALFLEEPQVVGVQGFADSSVTIRVSAKTLPLKQWDVAREMRRRIKNRFDAEGIEIPYPHLTFYWGDGQARSVGTAGDAQAQPAARVRDGGDDGA